MIAHLLRPDEATLDRLAALHSRAFEPEARGWSAAEIGSLTKGGALFTVDHGFLLMRPVLDEAEVLTIAIDPMAQGRGYGRMLLVGGLAIVGAREAFLEVAADNRAAIALYRSTGFEEIGRRKGYYERANGASVDALTMRRQEM
ncbi:MAG: GNAT family N-acetyltransferase [Pikeienuella sp.]